MNGIEIEPRAVNGFTDHAPVDPNNFHYGNEMFEDIGTQGGYNQYIHEDFPPLHEEVIQRAPLYSEAVRNTGEDFLTFVTHSYMRGQKPKVDFIPKSLKEVMSTYNYSDKPLLLLAFKADHPNVKPALISLLNDKDFAQMANTCFYPVGVLASSREVRVVMNFITARQLPCFLVIRMVPGSSKEIKCDDMVAFGDCSDPNAFTERVHNNLANYLKKRNDLGAKFVYPQPGQSKKEKIAAIDRDRQ